MASSAPSTSGVKTSPPISVNYSTLAYSLNTVVRAVKTTLGGLDSLGTDLSRSGNTKSRSLRTCKFGYLDQ